jgi:hypothetical protein
MAAAVRLQATDFAVEHDSVRTHSVRDFLRELRPRAEHVPVAGDELTAMARHMRECVGHRYTQERGDVIGRRLLFDRAAIDKWSRGLRTLLQ